MLLLVLRGWSIHSRKLRAPYCTHRSIIYYSSHHHHGLHHEQSSQGAAAAPPPRTTQQQQLMMSCASGDETDSTTMLEDVPVEDHEDHVLGLPVGASSSFPPNSPIPVHNSDVAGSLPTAQELRRHHSNKGSLHPKYKTPRPELGAHHHQALDPARRGGHRRLWGGAGRVGGAAAPTTTSSKRRS